MKKTKYPLTKSEIRRMFTGIIEQTGIIEEIRAGGSNKTFKILSDLSKELKVDQSLSHNGVCLTVESISGNSYLVTAIDETLKKTNLGSLQQGDTVNLERCLRFDGRLDGHLVQGHVDTTATCSKREDKSGSWEFSFTISQDFAALIIEKGSICLNGISLTIFNVTDTGFTVAVIPYTFEHTNIKTLQVNDRVNIEFDMIGKYVNRINVLR